MPTTLQYLFIQSRGSPVVVGDWLVHQLARIPIRVGVIRVRMLSPPDKSQGVCLKAEGGAILLSDGSSTETLQVWHEPDLPDTVVHRVNCPSNELRVWNTYRVRHPTGQTTIDHWTGAAGMVLLEEHLSSRRYGCNDWRDPFDPSRFSFEVAWNEETTAS
jgi:hypothetical protein